jgi:putative hemolysin
MMKTGRMEPSEQEALTVRPAAGPAAPLLDRLLGLTRLTEVLRSVGTGRADFVAAVLAELGIAASWTDRDLARVPTEGPLLVLANHPHGGADGLVALDLLLRARADVRVLGNRLLGRIAGMRPWLIEVDPLRPGDGGANLGGLRRSLEHLRRGGCLLAFPAGEVASLRLGDLRVRDPRWSAHVVRLARSSAARILPLHIGGRNRGVFQAAGLVHPRLRTALLTREMLALRGKTLRVRAGAAMEPEALAKLPDDDDAAKALRLRSELLPHRPEEAPRARPAARALAPLARETASSLLRAELESLPPECQLASQGTFRVFCFRGEDLPHCMREIGRLREITFRAVSEGSGLAADLDAFDGWYEQLVAWDDAAGCLVGGYRVGATDRILPARGKRGLYTSTLFDFRTDFFRRLDPALELGRSFIRPEYQRKAGTLPLLWRGIGRYVARNPRYHQLFGPVSINPEYSPASRELMLAWLRHNRGARDLEGLVRAKNPPRQMSLDHATVDLLRECAYDFEHMSGLVSEMEEDGKAVPVLLKHYLRLNGRLIGFNVDPSFGGCLDGLIVVDLTQADRRLLEAYLGQDGAASFLAHHDAA